MRRGKKQIISIFLTMVLVLSSAVFSFALPQDANGHWAEKSIQHYLEKGTISGYEDGSFKPDNYITRAEFVTIINKYFGYTETADISFGDITLNAWYELQIQRALKAGYIAGYSDNSFRPDTFITRQEAASIIAKLLKFTDSVDTNEIEKFNDGKDIPSWSKANVNSLIKNNILKGYPDNTIGYGKFITRAEVLMLLDNIGTYLDSNTSKISSISITNGTVKLNLSKSVDGLTIEDFIISASLDDKSFTLKSLKYNAANGTFTFDVISKTSKVQTLKITVSAGSDDISGSASATIDIPVRSSSGGSGSSSSTGGTVNTAPTTPVITKNPATGNVSPSDQVTITASSTDAEGDSITYVWEGRLAETSTYPLGKQVIKVKAVDEHGLESQQAAIVFFVMDTSTGQGGVLLTSENSRIYENGIDGATITNYTFNVPSVSGHSGNDYAWVKGLNVNTQQWEELIPSGYTTSTINTSNGIYLEGNLTPGTYSRLEFYYYASHCMYGQSNITYTVEYSFEGIGAGVPAEAAPTASNVTFGGLNTVGSILTGDYDYADVNGDLEGYVDSLYNVVSVSEYQWYRSDDASGTNRTAITAADSLTYTITNDDAGKYLTFEVTPLAVTGVAGTIEGAPVESSPVYVLNTATDIITFKIPEETSAATIDSTNHTISVVVASDTVLTNLIPTITLSAGAVISPESLAPQNFTNPVTYTVTAEDQTTTQNWIITVTPAV